MSCSRVAEGVSLRTAEMALETLGLVKPSMTRAVVASSTAGFEEAVKRAGVSDPAPLVTLSLSSRMSLCALFVPMPLMDLILLRSSARMAFRISSDVRDESIIRAVDAPIPDTPMRRRKSSRSSLVEKP